MNCPKCGGQLGEIVGRTSALQSFSCLKCPAEWYLIEGKLITLKEMKRYIYKNKNKEKREEIY